MTAHAVYDTATGKLRSVGTVLADPLPAGLTAKELTPQEAAAFRDGLAVWDDATRTVSVLPDTRAEQAANRTAIEAALGAALDEIDAERAETADFLRIASPSNAQIAAYVRTLAAHDDARAVRERKTLRFITDNFDSDS